MDSGCLIVSSGIEDRLRRRHLVDGEPALYDVLLDFEARASAGRIGLLARRAGANPGINTHGLSRATSRAV